MMQVGSRELKNRLGRYLARVRRGESLVVTHRGAPVARLVPLEGVRKEDELERRLNQLEAEGHLRRARGVFKDFEPIHIIGGKALSRLILEDRE
ncbi:MAG TPA: type II toxin-antitoxin system prevent-host-death family antitoxin [Candidatus Acidoferrales bacterium]